MSKKKYRENSYILKNIGISFLLFLVIIFIGLSFSGNNNKKMENINKAKIELPEIKEKSNVSVEEAIKNRRSIRNFKDQEVALSDLSQILWAAQGVTEEEYRASPSAGATYPLEVYVFIRKVDGLESGIYRFIPEDHSLIKLEEGDFSKKLQKAALNQGFIGEASFKIVFSAIYERTTKRYGERGERYVYMEAGHAAQNAYLQCESLDLGMVVVGAFDDESVRNILSLKEGEYPLYIIPVGKK